MHQGYLDKESLVCISIIFTSYDTVYTVILANSKQNLLHSTFRPTRLGAVYRPQSEGRGLSSTDIFRTSGEGVLQMWMSALFCTKNSRFFEIYGMPARTRGVDPMWTRREGVNFSRFCADVFYGRPLTVNWF